MKPYKHQSSVAKEAINILNKYSIVYLAMAERTGKTLVSLMAAGERKVLILTKKAAISGWNDTIEKTPWLKGDYTVTNYQQVHKIDDEFDLVILDEAHNFLSTNPKKGIYGKIYYKVQKHTLTKPVIYLSATPSAQGWHMLYNQLSLSKYSPFNAYENFYKWYEHYAKRTANGSYKMIKTSSTRYAKDYTQIKEQAKLDCAHLFITKTRSEIGYKIAEPTDVLHYITLEPRTQNWYNTLVRDRVLKGRDKMFIGDTAMGMRCALHQIEGGGIKVDDESIVLPNQEKIDYVKAKWGDNKNVAIMYNYISEKQKLEQHFKHTQIFQSTSKAEGVDLSHIETLIIYSQDFSSARFSQRRCRQINPKRKTPVNVHFLLVAGGISEKVYETVSINKKNFIDKYFQEVE